MIKNILIIALSLLTFWSVSAQTYFGEKDILFQFDGYNGPYYSTCDIDGDGDIDFLLAPESNDTLVWYENTDGNCTLGEPHIISDTANGSIKTCDIDGDGDIDVLAASSKVLAWYENSDGDGTFEEPQVIPGVARLRGVCDIDGDGDLDVLASSSDVLAWNANTDGNGTFAEPQVIPGFVGYVNTCDIDGDGDQDVLKHDGYYLAWNENTDGNGTFGEEQRIFDHYLGAVIPCDIDGDGDLDILLTTNGFRLSGQPDYITWFENTDGSGTFYQQHTNISTFGLCSISVCDIDSDDDLDILLAKANYYGGNGLFDGGYEISWYENTDGNGTFGIQHTILDGWSPTSDPVCYISVCTYDIDGDEDQDVLSATSFNDKITWYINSDGNGTFDEEHVIIVDSTEFPRTAVARDIDGDGDQDVLSLSLLNKIIIAWHENFTIEILTQPTNDDICPGSGAAFSLTATGVETYQWQVNEGAGFIDVSDNSVYSGVTSHTLTISNADTAMNGNIYRCVLNPAGTIVSDEAVLTFDSISPEITSTHADISINAGSDCEAILPDYTGEVTATDNCDTELNITQDPIAGTTISGQTNTVSLKVSDDMGNTDDITFNVAVEDNTSPEITSIHSDLIVNAGSDCEAILPDYTGEVTATDNCDTELNITQDPIAGTTISGQTNMVNLTVSDDMGNTDEVTFNVAVEDNTSPEITSIHSDLIVNVDSDCEAILPDYTGEVTAIDNCDTELSVTQDPIAGTIISGQTNTVSLTVSDDMGNTEDITFNVAVEDNTSPEITSIHSDLIVNAGSDCEAILPDYTGEVTATDNCDTELNITQDPIAGTTISGQTNTVSLTVSDDMGNTDEVIFNIVVEDNTTPTVSCAGNQTVVADETHYYTVSGAEFDPTETSDNCGVAGVENDFNNTATLAGAQIPEGANTITWTITDNAGNDNTCSFDITVTAFSVGVEKLQQKGISIYPNPTTGIVNFEFTDNHIQQINIFEITGNQIFEKKQIQQNETLDLSGFESGIYLICIRTNEEVLVIKMMKE